MHLLLVARVGREPKTTMVKQVSWQAVPQVGEVYYLDESLTDMLTRVVDVRHNPKIARTEIWFELTRTEHAALVGLADSDWKPPA